MRTHLRPLDWAIFEKEDPATWQLDDRLIGVPRAPRSVPWFLRFQEVDHGVLVVILECSGSKSADRMRPARQFSLRLLLMACCEREPAMVPGDNEHDRAAFQSFPLASPRLQASAEQQPWRSRGPAVVTARRLAVLGGWGRDHARLAGAGQPSLSLRLHARRSARR